MRALTSYRDEPQQLQWQHQRRFNKQSLAFWIQWQLHKRLWRRNLNSQRDHPPARCWCWMNRGGVLVAAVSLRLISFIWHSTTGNARSSA